MNTFKTFLKVINKYKLVVIMYTVILIVFAGFNMQTKDNSMSFIADKPDVLIVNYDKMEGITKSLVNYISGVSNIVQDIDGEKEIKDAIFYRDVNYVIYIPENFNEDFLNLKNPQVEVKSTGDYMASLAEMYLNRYIKVASSFNANRLSEAEIIEKTEEVLKEEVTIELTSNLDVDGLNSATFYFNFTNYCILASLIQVICLVISSFKNIGVKKRVIVSATPYTRYNNRLLLANMTYAVIVWLFYIVLGMILLKGVMFSIHGLLFSINLFVFVILCLMMAFLLANLIKNKDAVNGIVNVIALGSSFLCGSFVPMEYLPNSVINIAHALPSYYFIKNNELIKTIESINLESLRPVLINGGILIIFIIGFMVINNIVLKRKERIG